MNYDTALRGYTAKRIEEIDSADILVRGALLQQREHHRARDPDDHSRIGQALPGKAQRHLHSGRRLHRRHPGGGQGVPDQALAGEDRLHLPRAGGEGHGLEVRVRSGEPAQRVGLRDGGLGSAQHHGGLGQVSPGPGPGEGLPVRGAGVCAAQIRRHHHQQHRLQPHSAHFTASASGNPSAGILPFRGRGQFYASRIYR